MRHFPLFLNLRDKRVVIVGGGEQAAQKCRLLRRTEAVLEIMALGLCDELRDLVRDGHARHIEAVLEPDVLTNASLVIVATGCAGADAVVADLARHAGAVVNVVDRPALSDAIMPAIVDRDPVVVAIGTEGTAPVLARQIKTRIESMLEPELGRFARLAGEMRGQVAQHIAPAKRRGFWEWAMGAPRRLMAQGLEGEARSALNEAIQSGNMPSSATGLLSIIDIGDGEADLLTLRAVERLQSADLIVHTTECPAAILDLARRDAERRVPNDLDGPSQWLLERELRRALADVETGQRVVWLGTRADVEPMLSNLAPDTEFVPAITRQPASPIVARAENA